MIFCESFLSHIAACFRRGTLPSFRKFLVSKSFRDEKGAVITIFHHNHFVSQYLIIS